MAGRIGVKRTQVYRHYPTKEAFFEAVMRHGSEKHVLALESIAAVNGSSASVLLRRLLKELHFYLMREEPRLLLKVVLGKGTHFPEASRVYCQAVVARSLAAIHRIVARGIACGEFRREAAFIPIQLFFAPAFLSAVWLSAFDHVAPLRFDRIHRAHLQQIER